MPPFVGCGLTHGVSSVRSLQVALAFLAVLAGLAPLEVVTLVKQGSRTLVLPLNTRLEL